MLYNVDKVKDIEERKWHIN